MADRLRAILHMSKRVGCRRYVLLIVLLLVSVAGFLATTNHPAIWPARNLLLYHVTRWWEAHVGVGHPPGVAVLRGCVSNGTGEAVAGAIVLVAEGDGTTHTATTDTTGCYHITNIPANGYVPVATAAGYTNVAIRPWGLPIALRAGEEHRLNITFPPVSMPGVAAVTELQFGNPVTLTWPLPQPGSAVRRALTYRSNGQPNPSTFLYAPLTHTEQLPALLAIYPGPVERWEGVSIPLAAAGYMVIALGPAYALDLNADVEVLQQLVALTRAGKVPGADGRRIIVLGGSYSSLHAQELLRRDVSFRGAVLLGPPTDLFDLRRRFEEGSFFPPFGLDQALIALGTPDTSPERYWQYSMRYHVYPGLPPLLLMHSRSDEVVPFQQSELLAAALEHAGVDYEAHFFSGMSHYLLADRPSADLDTLYTITLDFLKRRMKPE